MRHREILAWLLITTDNPTKLSELSGRLPIPVLDDRQFDEGSRELNRDRNRGFKQLRERKVYFAPLLYLPL